MTIDLESLGFTKEELQGRVVDQIVERLMIEKGWVPEEEYEYPQKSEFAMGIQKAVLTKVEAKINEIAQRDVLPKVGDFIENLILQETSAWGEKKGQSVTFIEYLIKRADNYIREEVDYNGVSKAEAESKRNSWYGNGKQTRLTFLVHQHLQHHIEHAMKDAVSNLNKAIVPALADTCRMKLAELSTTLKVSCETKTK